MLRVNVTMDSSVIVGEGEWIQIPLSTVLQNMLMHLILSVQMKSNVYKIVNISPGTESTRFMSTAVQVAEKERLANNEHYKKKDCKAEDNAVLYRLEGTNTPNTSNNRNCFHCGKPGHFTKECRAKMKCRYCKTSGHDTKERRERQYDKVSCCTRCGGCYH